MSEGGADRGLWNQQRPEVSVRWGTILLHHLFHPQPMERHGVPIPMPGWIWCLHGSGESAHLHGHDVRGDQNPDQQTVHLPHSPGYESTEQQCGGTTTHLPNAGPRSIQRSDHITFQPPRPCGWGRRLNNRNILDKLCTKYPWVWWPWPAWGMIVMPEGDSLVATELSEAENVAKCWISVDSGSPVKSVEKHFLWRAITEYTTNKWMNSEWKIWEEKMFIHIRPWYSGEIRVKIGYDPESSWWYMCGVTLSSENVQYIIVGNVSLQFSSPHHYLFSVILAFFGFSFLFLYSFGRFSFFCYRILICDDFNEHIFHQLFFFAAFSLWTELMFDNLSSSIVECIIALHLHWKFQNYSVWREKLLTYCYLNISVTSTKEWKSHQWRNAKCLMHSMDCAPYQGFPGRME